MDSESSQSYEEIFNMDDLSGDDVKLKVLYTNDSGCGCCTRWSEYADPVLETAILNQKLADYSIIRRMKKELGGHGQSGQNYQTHSIILRGTPLMRIVREAFDGYLGLDLVGTEITFVTPFKPVVHRWAQLESLANSSEEKVSTTIALAKRLLELFQPLVAPYLAALQDARTLGTISFPLLWTLFAPGDIATMEKMGVCSAYRVISLKFNKAEKLSKPDWWTIDYEHVDWNGSITGYMTGRTNIFEDKRDPNIQLAALPVIPLLYRDNHHALKEALLARGRKFEQLRGYQYKSCSGKKVVKVHEHYCEYPVSGRVVIDAFAYYNCQKLVPPQPRPFGEQLELESEADTHHHSSQPPPVPPAHGFQPYGLPNYPETHQTWPIHPQMPPSGPMFGFNSTSPSQALPPPPPPPPPVASTLPYSGPVRRSKKSAKHGDQLNSMPSESDASHGFEEKRAILANSRDEVLEPMTDEQCILANPLVKGFDMKDKDWYEFYVDDLSDILWNESLFSKLVLPEGEKDLALAFVQNKKTMKVDVDFVYGKGRGLVILMFGPPGVGKTFTAEAVAEECHLPLYSMCAGDLGTRAKEVEKGIDSIFECCALWNCILLLDEADVFMSVRTNEGLDRNELVSIFLRRMEQYEGILFLTTNRAKSVDPAFQSRIDLILPYLDLTTDARAEIWKNFINHLGQDKFDVREEDIIILAEIKLNGREIKNLLKSAQYLMMKEGSKKVTVEHLKRLAKMRMMAQKVLADS